MSEQVIFQSANGHAILKDGKMEVESYRSMHGIDIFDMLASDLANRLAAERAYTTARYAAIESCATEAMRLLDQLKAEHEEKLAAERAAREAAEAKLSAITAMGDVVQQASAWLAVKAALDDAGMLSFIGGDGTGKSRAVEFVKHLRTQLATVTAERDALATSDLGEALGELDMLRGVHAAALDDVSRLTAEIAKLRERCGKLLDLYAQHTVRCDMWRTPPKPCSCGLSGIYAEEATEGVESHG